MVTAPRRNRDLTVVAVPVQTDYTTWPETWYRAGVRAGCAAARSANSRTTQITKTRGQPLILIAISFERT